MSGRKLDLTNKRFGKLVALEAVYVDGGRKWRCICDCGSEVITDTFQLTGGSKQSCGCLGKTDLTGNKYGEIEVISYSHQAEPTGTRNRRYHFWNCKCVCGSIFVANQRYILFKKDKLNCGCLTFERMSKAAKKESGLSAKNSLIHSYKHNSKNKNLDFKLSNSELEILFKGNCYYCGDSPYKEMKSRNGSYIYNGIDRLDNTKGYIQENVVSCCTVCNYLKSNYSKEDFLNIVKKIAINLKLTL